MTDCLAAQLCGVRWRIDLSALYPEHASVGETLRHLWFRAAVDADGAAPVLTERTFTVLTDPLALLPRDDWGTPLAVRFRAEDGFPYEFSKAVTLACISARRGSALMLHGAALVRLSDGGGAAESPAPALVLVAGSGTGKSTAVRTLGPAYGYVTDETVVIEPDLTISAYTKPVSLARGADPQVKDDWSPDDLGLGVAPPSVTVGAVVLLDRKPGVDRPVLERIGLVDALLEVLPQTSSIQLLRAPLQELARVLTRGGGPYRLTYTDIADCASILAELPRATPDDAEAWTAHPPTGVDNVRPEPGTVGAQKSAEAGGIRRAAYADAIEVDGDVIVLLGTQPAKLSAIGATIWLAANATHTVGGLVERVVEKHGPHPEATDRTAAAINSMIAAAVLVRY